MSPNYSPLIFSNFFFLFLFSLFPSLSLIGHIEWHLEVGLSIQLIEAPLQAQQRNTLPQAMYDNCEAIGQSTSGNAAGHLSPLDLSGLPSGPFPQNLGWHPRGIGAMAG